jgi:hypothetical protein
VADHGPQNTWAGARVSIQHGLFVRQLQTEVGFLLCTICSATFRQLFLSDHLPELERLQILRILRDTLPGLPDDW